MRASVVVLLAVLGLSAQAQIDPLRYRPLAVGDVWVYETRVNGVLLAYLSHQATADTTIGGAPYVLVETTLRFAGSPSDSRCRAALAVQVDGSVERVYLGGEISETGCAWHLVEPLAEGAVSEEAPDTFTIGATTYTFDAVRTTHATGYVNANTPYEKDRWFATDVGLVQYLYVQCPVIGSGCTYVANLEELAFASVGGQVYGENPVATEDDPVEGTDLSLTATPNPARDAIRLRLALPEAGAVRVEAYDVTGRRVHAADLGARPAGASTATVDVSRWAPGLYVVRVTTGYGQAAARVVRTE
jgi:hypothetical protein